MAAWMIYANAGGLALCLLAALARWLGCTVRARRIAAGWKRAGVVFLPGAEGLVEYGGAVHDPAPPPERGRQDRTANGESWAWQGLPARLR